MPRKGRIDAPGALHHIIIRGIERKAIFKDRIDRNNFLSRLDRIVSETETGCYAWVLMGNHVHLLSGGTQVGIYVQRCCPRIRYQPGYGQQGCRVRQHVSGDG